MRLNNKGEVPEFIFGVIAVIVVVILFTAATGGYDNMNWDELVPLFKILIPYLFVVGFPLIVVAAALIIVKTGKTGSSLIADLFRKPAPVKVSRRKK